MKKNLIAPLIIAGLFLSVSVLPAEITIAVLNFKNHTGLAGYDKYELGIPELLITEFSKTKELKIIERERLNKILEEQKLTLSGALDENSARIVGKLLSADYLVTGGIHKGGDTYRIDVHVLDVKTGTVKSAEKVYGDIEKQIFTMAEELASRITASFGIQIPASQTAVPTKATVPQIKTYPKKTVVIASGRKDAPCERSFSSAVWDEKNKRMLVFGGSDASGNFLNDLWSFDGRRWTQLNPEGELPPPMWAHSAVWDPMKSRMLVFGGTHDGFQYMNDLWSYDGEKWEKLNSGGVPPSPRTGASMVWDSRNNRVILFGGQSYKGDVVWNNDVWIFEDNYWTELKLEGRVPEKRSFHSAVWDSKNDRMLIFEGYGEETFRNDLWGFDGNGWTELTLRENHIKERHAHTAVWDSKNNRMFIFGGYVDKAYISKGEMSPDEERHVYMNDLWGFDGNGLVEFPLSDNIPPERHGHTAVWDSANNRMLIFAGRARGDNSRMNDVWSFDGEKWTQLFTGLTEINIE